MKVTVNGNALVLTSDIKAKEIELLKKVNPSALKLKDEDGNDIFAIGLSANGGINKNGVSFDGKTRDEDKLATVTVNVPAGTKDVEQWVSDTVLPVWDNLTKISEQITAAGEKYGADKAALLEVTEIA